MAVADPTVVARTAAASAAVELVEPGSVIGLGSGRAVWSVAALLGDRLADAEKPKVVVGSSRTYRHARRAGLKVVSLDGSLRLTMAIDGADEVDPKLGLLKGGGAALLREKIIVAAAERFIVVAETAKRVERLGSTRGIPVEVVRFGWRDTRVRLLQHVESAEVRRDNRKILVTDEGHYIIDCVPRATGDIAELGAAITAMPGVVEHGLFLTEADIVLLGTPEGAVERYDR